MLVLYLVPGYLTAFNLCRAFGAGRVAAALAVIAVASGLFLGFMSVGRMLAFIWVQLPDTTSSAGPAMEAKVALPDGKEGRLTDRQWTMEDIVRAVEKWEAAQPKEEAAEGEE